MLGTSKRVLRTVIPSISSDEWPLKGSSVAFGDVCRRLGGADILRDLSLYVEAGEIVALVGANGVGKSTLIKALLDLRAIDAGSISIEGRPHTDARARDRVAYLPERFQPAYYLRGRGFIEYMLALYGAAPDEGRIERVCSRLGLGPQALGASVQTYSKGMSQMLGLAACLLSGRPILVLDEPMSGLDPTARVRLQGVLREHREDGGTILFTTHLMADAEALADRVAVLHGGHIVADAAPTELMAQYQVSDLESAFVECVGGIEAPAH